MEAVQRTVHVEVTHNCLLSSAVIRSQPDRWLGSWYLKSKAFYNTKYCNSICSLLLCLNVDAKQIFMNSNTAGCTESTRCRNVFRRDWATLCIEFVLHSAAVSEFSDPYFSQHYWEFKSNNCQWKLNADGVKRKRLVEAPYLHALKWNVLSSNEPAEALQHSYCISRK